MTTEKGFFIFIKNKNSCKNYIQYVLHKQNHKKRSLTVKLNLHQTHGATFKTSTFEWTLGNIKIEKIILATIWDTRHCPKLLSLQYLARTLISDPIWAPKNFLLALLLLKVRQCSKLSSCACSQKTKEPNMKKWQEKLI